MRKIAYCIFCHTLLEGYVPSVRDEHDFPVTFATERDAQLEIADHMMTQLQEFIEGARDFEDATSIDEVIEAVTVLPDGSVVDETGNRFSSRRST